MVKNIDYVIFRLKKAEAEARRNAMEPRVAPPVMTDPHLHYMRGRAGALDEAIALIERVEKHGALIARAVEVTGSADDVSPHTEPTPEKYAVALFNAGLLRDAGE